MDSVYVLRYSLPYESTELVSVYASLRGAINRLTMMEVNNSFDGDETVTIERLEIISDEESLNRLNNIREHYEDKPTSK